MWSTKQIVALWTGIAAIVVVVVAVCMIVFPAYGRYQARANANNSVKVSAIEIKNQAQRVLIAKQQADIQYQQSVGVRKAQDEIARTLTPIYVAYEMTKAMESIATSGTNNTVIYIPTNPKTGLPVVPTSAPEAAKTAGK
jgi:hypothetical protein